MKKILIIEDQLENVELISHLVNKSTNAEIFIAEDVAASLFLLKLNKYDFIICDYLLTDGTGDYVLEYLKSNAINVPLVFFTSKQELTPTVNYPVQDIITNKDYDKLFSTLKNLEILAS